MVCGGGVEVFLVVTDFFMMSYPNYKLIFLSFSFKAGSTHSSCLNWAIKFHANSVLYLLSSLFLSRLISGLMEGSVRQ